MYMYLLIKIKNAHVINKLTVYVDAINPIRSCSIINSFTVIVTAATPRESDARFIKLYN